MTWNVRGKCVVSTYIKNIIEKNSLEIRLRYLALNAMLNRSVNTKQWSKRDCLTILLYVIIHRVERENVFNREQGIEIEVANV